MEQEQSRTLAERFRESGGSPIQVDDTEICLARDISLSKEETRATVTFRAAKLSPTQGVCLRMTGGRLEVAGQESTGVVLWSDTAPPEVELTIVHRPRKPSVLRVWNCWRGGHDEVQAWVGNSGLVVEQLAERTYRFHGSDGGGDPDFGAIVFELRLIVGPV